jgi:hypothetical protein
MKKSRPLCKVCERNREGIDIELNRRTVNGRIIRNTRNICYHCAAKIQSALLLEKKGVGFVPAMRK